MAKAPTPPRVSPSSARRSREARRPRSSAPPGPQMFASVSAPIDMTTLTIFILPLARSLGSNSLTNHGADMSGLLKLVEVLPQTKIESLECAAAQVFAFVSAPVDTLATLSPSPLLPHPQSLQQRHRGQGRLRARRRPQGDADHQAGVRHPQSVCFCVNDTPALSPYPHLVPILRSLGCNGIGPQGAAKLAAVLSQTQITNLECAAPLEPDPSVCFPVSAH